MFGSNSSHIVDRTCFRVSDKSPQKSASPDFSMMLMRRCFERHMKSTVLPGYKGLGYQTFIGEMAASLWRFF